MSLSSSSTAEEIQAEYQECCGYDIVNSTALAGRFVIACRMLLALPASAAQEGASHSFDLVNVRRQHDAALAWLSVRQSVNGANSIPRQLAVENWR